MKLQLSMSNSSFCEELLDEDTCDWMALYLHTKGAKQRNCEYHIELGFLDKNGEKFISKSYKANLTKDNCTGFDKFIHRTAFSNPFNKLSPN